MSMADETISAAPATLLKDCRHGKFLFLRRDQYVGRSLDLYGEFSELEATLFEQIVHTGDVVVEVGANIGAHTARLARLVGPRGTVVAFEPQRFIFQLLCANVALNELFNVYAYQFAVGAEPGSLNVPPLDYRAANNFGGISLPGKAVGEQVRIMPLDQFGLPSLRLLKIDVEGMEIGVLHGARKSIARYRPILYVENDRKQHSEALIGLIESYGYNLWWHFPPLFNPANFAGNTDNVFGGTSSINLLCMPKESQLVIEGFRKVTGPTDWWQ